MKKVKKSEKSSDLKIKCSRCGRETPHYVNAKGEVRCAICQTVAKKVTVNTPKEVVFEVDEEFDKLLNPVKPVIKEVVAEPEDIEVPVEVGPEFDDDLPM